MRKKEKIIKINIEDEIKSSYINYSMSVIISRALPDVRDGLKPVHRRILYSMYKLGVKYNSTYKKSARIVGEVLGKFHPHGDTSVYDSIVRMAQDWSLRYKLIKGQGNFGSIDNDPPAAMRYTEIRLEKISEEMLKDIEKNTVDMKLNFDDSLKEPTVLPTRIPNLLINGVSGIAVGMATNIPPHNLKESINAICAYINNKNIDINELMKYIKGPDFPTGGIIYGDTGIKKAFETGKGKIIIRAKALIKKKNGKNYIIINELPYQVVKNELIKKTLNLIKEGKLEGISKIRDESDRKGLHIVYFIKKNFFPKIILNKLFKQTSLEINFNINTIALVKGKPKQLNLKKIIKYFVNHRHNVFLRKIQFQLNKAKKKEHILISFLKILNYLNIILNIIKKSKNSNEAKIILIKNFKFSKKQSKSILNIRLQKITGFERNKIKKKFIKNKKDIIDFKKKLGNKKMRMNIIQNELIKIQKKYGDSRKTKIDYINEKKDKDIKKIFFKKKFVLTISHAGYIKKTSLSKYRCQNIGGIGNKGVITKNQDFLEHLFIANNYNYMLIFTKKGKCFWLRIFKISNVSKISKGQDIQNFIKIDKDDKVCAYILTDDLNNKKYIFCHYVIMITKKGIIKKTCLKEYSRPRKNGINAITIYKNDKLLEAKLTKGNSEILIAIKSGKAIRFSENNIRSICRTSYGVRSLFISNKKDYVIGMICIKNFKKEDILVVSKKGFGKRSKINNYKVTNRGGKGIKTMNITKKTGFLISIKNVSNNDDLIIINKSGVNIRISVSQIPLIGRDTQGIRLINLKNTDQIADITKVKYNNFL